MCFKQASYLPFLYFSCSLKLFPLESKGLFSFSTDFQWNLRYWERLSSDNSLGNAFFFVYPPSWMQKFTRPPFEPLTVRDFWLCLPDLLDWTMVRLYSTASSALIWSALCKCLTSCSEHNSWSSGSTAAELRNSECLLFDHKPWSSDTMAAELHNSENLLFDHKPRSVFVAEPHMYNSKGYSFCLYFFGGFAESRPAVQGTLHGPRLKAHFTARGPADRFTVHIPRSSLEFSCSDLCYKMEEGEFWFLCNFNRFYAVQSMIFLLLLLKEQTLDPYCILCVYATVMCLRTYMYT